MPKSKKSKPVEVRLDELEAEVATLRAQLAELGATPEEVAEIRDDVEDLRAAVEARGAKPNPTPGLTSKARASRAKNAAVARAAKPVGKGSGRVSTKEVQEKLQREATQAKPGRRRPKKGSRR